MGNVLPTVTAFRKVPINDGDQITRILIGPHLRIHKSIDLCIYFFRTFKRDAGETSHDVQIEFTEWTKGNHCGIRASLLCATIRTLEK